MVDRLLLFALAFALGLAPLAPVLADDQAGDVATAPPANPYAPDPNLACGPYCLAFVSAYLGLGARYGDIALLCSPGAQQCQSASCPGS